MSVTAPESAPPIRLTPLGALNTHLGRITMYRLLTLILSVTAAAALIFAVTGQISYPVKDMVVNLIVLLAVCVLVGRGFAVLFGVLPHTESSLITALLLFFILQPVPNPGQSLWGLELIVALAAVFSSASKYLLAFRGRHIFNPASVGAVWVAIWSVISGTGSPAYWWVGTGALLPFTAIGALLIIWRTRRLDLILTFFLLAAVVSVVHASRNGSDFSQALKFSLVQSPIVFFAGFMLSEPLTQPPLRWQRLLEAVVVGVLFAFPFTIGNFGFAQESALLVGNAVAFLFGQRRGVDLILRAKNKVGADALELVFEPHRPVRFQAGQYLELTVPHRGMDMRGARRTFSISSAPGANALTIGLKMPDRPSSFKKALAATEIGSTVRATGVAGDFVLGQKAEPLLMIAGGIGITPFLAQLEALGERAHEAVLVWAVGGESGSDYVDRLSRTGARIVLVSKYSMDELPRSVEVISGTRLDKDVLARAVPDVARRSALLSGPPQLVDAMTGALRELGARRVRKDYFFGY